MKPKAIIVAGPTAVGKTTIAEHISKKYELPIISADSRQIYKELGVAVAKPSSKSLKSYEYVEINSVSIFEEQDVTHYCERVQSYLDHKKYPNIIVCGGTGFYLKSLMHGYENLPKRNPDLRNMLQKEFETNGIEPLQKIYSSLKNPQKVKDLSNPQRLIRAIEIGEKRVENTRTIAPLEDYDIEVIALNLPREELYKRINARVEEMASQGLFKEAKELFQHKELNALQTVGYSELFKHFEGQQSEEQALEEIKKNTRRYSKRQITFFKNQFPDAKWFTPKEFKKIDTFVQNTLK